MRLEGHSGGVRSVAWSPSGERLASGSDDKAVLVWDGGSGAQVTHVKPAISSAALNGMLN